jgi:hypothetical protein
MPEQDVNPTFIERIDEAKRSSVRKMAKLTFAVPVIASFSMAGLSSNEAHAQVYSVNQTHIV